jgi:hypothetical protein
MTTIEILKKATINSVNKSRRSITASGTDTVTGKMYRRTFFDNPDQILGKAEYYVGKRDVVLTIQVDSGTKTIDLRADPALERVLDKA